MKKNNKNTKVGIRQSYKLLWKFMGIKEKITFISIFAMSLVSALTHTYGAILPSLIIAKFTGEEILILKWIPLLRLDTIPFLAVTCGTVIVLWVFGMLHYRMIDIFARRMMCVTNEKVQDIILEERKNLEFGMTTGEVNYILKNAVDNIYSIVEPFCWNFVTNVVSAIFMTVQLCTLGAAVGLISVALEMIILVCVYIRMKFQNPVVEKIEKTNAKIGNHFLMSLTNLPMITIFKSKKRELEELKKLNNDFYKVNKKRANISFWYWLIVTAIEYVGLAVLIGVYAGMNKGVSIVAAVTVIINEILMIYTIVENWGYILSDLQSASIKFCNLQKIFAKEHDLISETAKIDENVKTEPLETIEVVDYSVKLRSFKKTYNIRFDSGKIYVISGQSGQGKTTLINAICGLREISSGHLLVNNLYEVKSLYNYRDKISYLFQDTILFDRSLEENIAYPDNQINQRAKTLVEFFDMQKLISRNHNNTLISQTLSGGEKKRVDIIRTVSKEKELYFLDEPTNDLDADNVEKVLQVIKALAEENKIVVVVTHDSRVLEIADEVVEL